MNKFKRFMGKTPVLLALILLAATCLKLVLIVQDALPFNADEAIVGLMARHILGGARPVFFYGQAYMGSLDAFLVAGMFALLGQQVWVIRLVQLLLYLGTIITTVALGRVLLGSVKAGLWAGVLLAVPTVNTTLYTTVSLGGYGEALLLGNLILLTGMKIKQQTEAGDDMRKMWLWLLLWGGLVGCGLWANGLTLVYAAPMGLIWLAGAIKAPQPDKFRRLAGCLLVMLAGFLLGSFPWWSMALAQGPQQLLTELAGTAVAVEQDGWPVQVARHAINLVLLGGTVIFGLRPPWEVRWLGLPLVPFALVFWAAVILFMVQQSNTRKMTPVRSGYRLLGWVAVTLILAFIFTPFGIDPSGRYFVPLSVVLALAAGGMLVSVFDRLRWQAAGVGLIVIFHLWGTMQCAQTVPPGLTTQFDAETVVDMRQVDNLAAFLRDKGETRGYSTYWVAYPLAFVSGEAVIFAPRLPYHRDLRYTPRDDRYPAYTSMVAASPRTAYITGRAPELDEVLRTGLTRLGVTWKEGMVGDFRVYYELSRAVRVDELGQGAAK